MAIPLTWPNIFAMVGLISVVLTGLVMGTAAIVEWRMSAMQHQLADRLDFYNHQIEQIERRIERLEPNRR